MTTPPSRMRFETTANALTHTHTNLQCCQQRHRPSHRDSPLCVCTGAGTHQDECHHKRVKTKPCVRRARARIRKERNLSSHPSRENPFQCTPPRAQGGTASGPECRDKEKRRRHNEKEACSPWHSLRQCACPTPCKQATARVLRAATAARRAQWRSGVGRLVCKVAGSFRSVPAGLTCRSGQGRRAAQSRGG